MAYSFKLLSRTLGRCNQALTKHVSTANNNQKSGYNFQLSETQKEYQQLARKFAREEIIPVAHEFDKTGEFPWQIIKKAHSIGLLNLHVPQQSGGLELGVLEACVITEEVGYGCTSVSTTLAASGIAQYPVVIGGNKDQQKKYLGRLMEEPLLAAFCCTEPGAGSDVNGIKTRAKKKGDEYIINGEKMWISNAGVANWYLVLARTAQDPKTPASQAFTAFIVDRDAPGVTPGRKERNMGQRAADNRGVSFQDVRVPKENMISGEGSGFKIVMQTFDNTRPITLSAAVGLSQRAMDEAARYAVERKSHGRAIAEQQCVGFMLADMAIGLEVARLAILRSAWELDERGYSPRATYLSSVAKTYSGDMANRVASNAVQIFGGCGYNSDYPVEKLMRDAKMYQIVEGTNEIQKLIISRDIIRRTKKSSS